ncbi:MAG: DEAD/DEAH box helicase [Kiloniellales bacterium]|nr:DEAD/DEAH box helicase [Kiloniellales bacterium]
MTDSDFSGLGLAEPLLRALSAQDYDRPTPIQAQAIPQLLAGKDLLGIAQTGTGKTAAFALPILQSLAAMQDRPGPRATRALVLAPTRELAIQIGEAFRIYGRHLPLRHAVIYGGVGQKPQVDALRRGVDILVATPGRLLDLMQQRHLRLDLATHFVLDEADRMLDMGFIRDVRKIAAALPQRRQTLLFSATMPGPVTGLAGALLHDPVRVAVTPAATPVERIEQRVFFVAAGEKRALLARILRDPALDRTIVFTRTKHRANRVAQQLEEAGIAADAIHGNKSQAARQRTLEAFRGGRLRVLVATDIAARGIDIDGVSHVINFELPNVPEDYVHRIGRTARAGASGAAISLCDPSEQAFLRGIEALTKRRLEVAEGAPAHPSAASKAPKAANRNKKPAHAGRRRRRRAQRPRRAA